VNNPNKDGFDIVLPATGSGEIIFSWTATYIDGLQLNMISDAVATPTATPFILKEATESGGQATESAGL
jgi:hypothetical protein